MTAVKSESLMAPAAISVITGDLVGSSTRTADEIDAAMQTIHAAADTISGWQTPAIDTRFTRFRGDGWQFYLTNPELSLRAALLVAALLRAKENGLPTRLSIAIGDKQTLGSRDLSDASGPAFELSGRQLDTMLKTEQITLSGFAVGERDKIIARQMFERTSRWTPPQAEAMALYLHPDNPTLQDIGRLLGISAQAVNYRLGGGGATKLRKNLQLWEEVMEHDLDAT
jgi:hypothetical protein